uniref:DOMON domain-containing protein n=1 Tax=Anopheles dirus TaxID=7168 RepID=A0A182MXM9_9DIPT
MHGRFARCDESLRWTLLDGGQDRHIRPDSPDGEPIVDPSQDYTLLLGYENTTHTVIRFKRNLDTCDMKDDFPITTPPHAGEITIKR